MKQRTFVLAALTLILLTVTVAAQLRPRWRSRTAPLPSVRVIRDVAYGSDPLQRFDAYIPSHAAGAPILVMVHGGGWRLGDKAGAGVVDTKAAHWCPRGLIVVSVNNRLLPATPLQQAEDVDAAIATIRQQAPAWGGDPAKLVLMGHSAGAHLVALVAARADTPDWLGTVLLDSAALDVVRLMESPHLPLYDQAFGRNPAVWHAVSPIHQLTRSAPPFLAVCSTQRARSSGGDPLHPQGGLARRPRCPRTSRAWRSTGRWGKQTATRRTSTASSARSIRRSPSGSPADAASLLPAN